MSDAFSAGLRSIAMRERSIGHPEIGDVIDGAAAAINFLQRELASSRAEVVRLTTYRDGLAVTSTILEVRNERLRKALHAARPYIEHEVAEVCAQPDIDLLKMIDEALGDAEQSLQGES